MRNVLTPALVLALSAAATGQITSFPYTEDFEGGDGQFFSSGTNSTWEWGTPSGGTFISRAASGSRAWVTNLTGTYDRNEASFLLSPIFDCTSFTTDPFVQFGQIFELDSSSSAFVDVSLDGGPFQRLGTVSDPNGINWYNGFDDTWRGNTGQRGVWRTARRPIDNGAGSTVQFRFGLLGGNFNGEAGIGVDDVQVFESLTDVSVAAILGPRSGPDLGTATVVVQLANSGTLPISNVPLSVTVTGPNGTVTVQETVNGTITANSTRSYGFSQRVDLSMPGDYSVTVTSTLVGDQNPGNDTLSIDVTSQGVITSLPYVEGFELGNGQFIAVGANSTWEVGRPASTFIRTAGSGQNAWVTNLTGPKAPVETSSLQSPPIDCRGLRADPFLSFSHVFQLFTFSEHFLEMSIDGQPYTQVGSFGEPGSINWYNDNFDNAWTGTSNQSGTWRTARVLLRGAAGSVITLRWSLRDGSTFSPPGDGVGIDNVQITEVPFGMGQAPDQVQLDINGAADAFGFPVEFGVPGPYFSTASSSGNGFELSMRGESGQPAFLFGGNYSAATATFPGAGQLDLQNFELLLNGTTGGGLNPFFVMNGSGDLRLTLTVPPSLVGVVVTFQGAALSVASPLGFALSNAVQVTFTP